MAHRPEDRLLGGVTADRTVAAPPTGRREDTSVPPRLPIAPETLTQAPSAESDVTRSIGDSSVPAYAKVRSIPGYEVLEELGRGGMGVVYKARHIALDRIVALKMILLGAHAREKDVDRFRAEALAVARFQHPNIVQIHEVGEADGLPYFSLEFVPGGTLSRKIARDPQEPHYAATTVEALARAMQYAHEHGIVHRDLKPSNVLMAEDGTPKITDFGLAKRADDDSGRTQTGQVLGTPSYMAPEQAGAQADKVGPATDVYALGATLYDLLTGRPPFSGSSVLDTLELVRTREPVPPGSLTGHLPRDLDTICLKCLQKDSARRYPTAGALADDLRRFLDGRPILARPVGAPERAWRWAKRNPWVAGLGSAVAILLVTVAAVTSVLSYSLAAKKKEAEDTAVREQALRVEAQGLEQKAVAEQKKAVAARDKELLAHKTAAEQRELALNTVRDVLLRVDELMKKDARLVPIRLDIIRNMLDKVDQIRDHAQKNPLEERTEAIAYSRIGEIYLKSNRITDAAEWLRKAHRLLKAVAEDAPNDPVALRNQATAAHSLAEAEWRLGNGARSRELNAEGLRLRQQRQKLVAAGTEMEQGDAAYDVADAYAKLAYDELRLGEPEAAERDYLVSDRLFEALPPPLPNWIKVKRIRYENKVRIADAVSKLNRPEEAQKHYLAALADRDALLRVTQRPAANVSLLTTDVGQSRMYLGDFHLMIRRDPEAASIQYAICMDLFQKVLADDPDNLDVRQRIAASHYRLGISAGLRPSVSPFAGAFAEVAPVAIHFAECLRLREELAKIDPTDTQGQVEVLLAYARVGRVEDVDTTAARLLDQAGADRQVLFQTACGLSIVGDGKSKIAAQCLDRAFAVLTKLVDGGWQDRGTLEADPDLDAVRRDKRFAELLKRMEAQKPDPG